MPQGISLHIGLNSVDPVHYQGWNGSLFTCEADAMDMEAIARSISYASVKTVLTKNATRKSVLSYISQATTRLKAGDIFFLSYSGHGGVVPAVHHIRPSNLCNTWCLYDGQLIDHEIYWSLAQFAPRVRIFILSDTSFGYGTVLRVSTPSVGAKQVFRSMPPEFTQMVYLQNKKFYDKLQSKPAIWMENVTAMVIRISACQDNQYCEESTFNGLFTSKVKAVWGDGSFNGGYRTFHRRIIQQMPVHQTPNYRIFGTKNKAFEEQRPFVIE